MIYVTVGTHNHPFTRLVKMMDGIAGEIDERVVIQIGPDTYVPRYAEHVDFVPRDVADAYIREARLVVAQPGCGIISTAISMGRSLVLVPRRPQYGEIIDDHQLDMVRALEGREGIRIVYDEQKLRTALDFEDVPTPNPQRRKLFDILSQYLDQVAHQRARHKHWSAVALLGVLALALALRLWGIDWGLPNGQTRSVSYHPDENTYLHQIATMSPTDLDFVIDAQGGQALVPYLLAALLKTADMTGWFELQPSEDFYIAHPGEAAKIYLLGRAISIVFGVLSVVLVYRVVRRAFPDASPWLAHLGALFLAIAPGHAVNCHYLETDLPVSFFVLLAVYWMASLVQQGRLRDYLLVGIAAGLAIGTKWSAAPLLPLLLVAHAVRPKAWRRPLALLGKESLRQLLVFGLMTILVFLLVNPYVALHPAGVLRDIGRSGNTLYTKTGGEGFLSRPTRLLTETLPTSLGWGLYLLGWVGIFLVLFDRHRTNVGVLALVWMLLFGVAAASTTYATIGRTLPSVPFFVILATSAVARLWAWALSSRPKQGIVVAGIVLSVCMALAPSVLADLFFCSDTARQDASHWIVENVPPGATFGFYDHEPYWDAPDLLYQDFYHPSNAGMRYQYTIYPLDPTDPPQPNSDYVIFTSRDVPSVEVLLGSEQEAALLRWMEEHYEVAAEFESTVNVLGYELRGWHHYFFTPHIQILRWKEGS